MPNFTTHHVNANYLDYIKSYSSQAVKARSTKYSDFELCSSISSDYISKLQSYHSLVASNLFDYQFLSNIRNQIHKSFQDPFNISLPKRVKSEMVISNASLKEIEMHPKLSFEEVSKGESYLRDNTSYVQLKDPINAIQGILDLILNKHILQIASSYLGCPPLLIT